VSEDTDRSNTSGSPVDQERLNLGRELRLARDCLLTPEGLSGSVGVLLVMLLWATWGRRPGSRPVDDVLYGAAHLIVMILLPLLCGLFALRLSPRDLGLTFGRPRVWLPIVLVFGAIVAPFIYAATHNSHFMQFYPFWSSARLKPEYFLLHQAVMFCVLFANEFFFRGFMLASALRRMPASAAIVFQMMPYAVGHAGKLPQEYVLSLVAGLGLGIMSYRGKSIWPGFMLHFVCALVVDTAAVPEVAREVPSAVLRLIGLSG